MKLPEAFAAKMRTLLQQEADAFLAIYEREEKTNGLRVNPLKIDPDARAKAVPFSLSPVPFCPTGFYYDPNEQPGKHPYHAAGLYYIQEPSAMAVAETLRPAPGERVLDLCAAPGGKTTQLGAMMENKGLLVANDIHSKRVKALAENIERLGLTNTVVVNEAPETLAERFPGFFDKILVDAPCSGEGMFRKEEEAASFWSQAHVEECAARQRRILQSAYAMLKEGGILVYSTCTFSPEENEQTIEWLLETYEDLRLLPIAKIGGIEPGRPEWTKTKRSDLAHTARLWPHRVKGEGHFIAKLQKQRPTPSWRGRWAKSNAPKTVLRLYRQFEQEALRTERSGVFVSFGTHVSVLPDPCPDLSGLKVVRVGLHLGEAKKERFEPNHALALALRAEEARHVLDLASTSEEIVRYWRGETLSTGGDRGWLLVTVDGFPFAWGKEVKGTVKNFYPKGLRLG
ncbi:RsmF rRNA methyltransferase first C-terminal domain-containing protein [Geobacillus sp. FSL W8-0032]|uniref:Ribosomal RNA small subunit methyltransferase F n=1 Tax=Geobacillus icigianus TaxID=1430331 RepID=A0ABU6BI39_9BACL|nr:RsmF rRNA methyltransferase first C-terminal domain-containing protein [Geobacillus icigianus]MEB3751632.1 Ribosomal RNA small subunit methyltransferase F [Geobacillus icigianus]